MGTKKYYSISSLANGNNDAYCFLDTLPEGIGASSYRLGIGKPLAKYFNNPVTWKLGRRSSALKQPSLLGNTCQILAVHVDVSKLIQGCCGGEIEVWPFTLLNHRGRVHSESFVFVNPIGSVDCLHIEHTRFDRREDGSVFNIDHIVLDKQKLVNPPDLFRIREDPTIYVISERLANAFSEKGFTNIVLQELEVA